jgi:hypothetical protein
MPTYSFTFVTRSATGHLHYDHRTMTAREAGAVARHLQHRGDLLRVILP